MEIIQTYCQAVERLPQENIHRIYHDTVYGFPLAGDNELFARLVLEINQAGLSWSTILKKQEAFRQAYAQFDIVRVAGFGERDRERLLNDPGIIRNRLKIDAAIYNARAILALQAEYGSFKNWLDGQGDLSLSEWVKRFKKIFKFVGGEIANEFLVSTGYLPGAHSKSCSIYQQIIPLQPAWLKYETHP